MAIWPPSMAKPSPARWSAMQRAKAVAACRALAAALLIIIRGLIVAGTRELRLPWRKA